MAYSCTLLLQKLWELTALQMPAVFGGRLLRRKKKVDVKRIICSEVKKKYQCAHLVCVMDYVKRRRLFHRRQGKGTSTMEVLLLLLPK